LKQRKWITALMLAVLIVVQSFGPTTAQAAEEDLKGLVFQASRANSVKLNGMLDSFPATFEMLAKFEVNPNVRQVLFGNYNAGATAFSIELSASNQLRYYEVANGKIIDKTTSGQSITTGAWTHLALTRDPANKRVTIYQDGAVIATFDNLDLAEKVIPVAPHSIGTDTRNSMYVRAEIAEVRLWNDIRTQDELKDNSHAVLKGDEGGLKHAWMLNDSVLDGLVNVVSDKAGKLNGTPNGFPRTYTSEFQGTGANFASGKLELAMEELPERSPRTFETWVKIPEDTPSNKRIGAILSNYESQSYNDISRISFEIGTNGNPRLFWRDHKDYELNYYANNVNLNVGDWVHLAIVLNDADGTVSTYVNGDKIHEAKQATPLPKASPFRELKIGSTYEGYTAEKVPTVNFNGELADVRIWSTARTAEEIKANYNDYLQGNELGLIGNWKMDQAADGVYTDGSPNGNDVIPYNNETFNWLEPDFADGDYTIAVIPDTQYMAESHPQAMKNYFNWLKDNAKDKNIKLAISVGDIVNTASSTAQWKVAADSYAYLDGVIPYVVTPGNHDGYRPNYGNFNAYFPFSKYSKEPSFGGAMVEGNTENTYYTYKIGDLDYLVLAMDFGPSDAILAWADEVIAANPDKRVIITTHSYMYHNGEQINKNHHHYPSSYLGDANNGDDMWNELVRKHENIVLVVSGHIGYSDLVVREDIGDHGNQVQQVLVDAQYMNPQDLSMVMLMTFKEGSNNVDVNWYSVKNDKLFRAKNQLSMNLNLYPNNEPNPGEEIKLGAANQTVAKGAVFTVPVTVENGAELTGLEGVLKYDKAILTLENFEWGAFKEAGAMNTGTPGKVGFAGIISAPLGNNGKTVIANVTFRAKADLGGADTSTEITFENMRGVVADHSGESIYVSVQSEASKIMIVSRVQGDVNGDDTVDLLDARAILKLIVAGAGQGNESQLEAADMNGDGKVDTSDVLALLQIIADKLTLEATAPQI
jgi:hypothetical protein